MSVSEATEMMSLLRLSYNKARDLRILLKNTNIGNFMPSEGKIRHEQNKRLAHLGEDQVEFGSASFKFGTIDEHTFKERPYVKVKKLIPFIKSEYLLIKIFREDKEFCDEIWIIFFKRQRRWIY